MAQLKILMVEDDESLRILVREYLEISGYAVEDVGTAADFSRLLTQKTFDLILLDLNLPDEDGMALLHKLRADSRIPLFVISGRMDDPTRLEALETGADDYILKPLRVRELVLRIRNFFARHGDGLAQAAPASQACFAGFTLDLAKHRLYRGAGEKVISRGEFNLLSTLVQARGGLVSRKELLGAIGGDSREVNPETLTVLIYRLRKKLEPVSDGKIIVTVPGVGYRLGVPVDLVDPD